MKKFISKLFSKCLDKNQVIGEDLCQQCSHDFNTHLVKGYSEPPTEGWVECPVEGWECDMTWSMDKESKEGIEKVREESEN